MVGTLNQSKTSKACMGGSRTVRGGVHAPCMEGFMHHAWRGAGTMCGGFTYGAWGVHAPCMGGSENFKCPPLFVLGYHWLPIATIDLVGNNREIEV